MLMAAPKAESVAGRRPRRGGKRHPLCIELLPHVNTETSEKKLNEKSVITVGFGAGDQRTAISFSFGEKEKATVVTDYRHMMIPDGEAAIFRDTPAITMRSGNDATNTFHGQKTPRFAH